MRERFEFINTYYCTYVCTYYCRVDGAYSGETLTAPQHSGYYYSSIPSIYGVGDLSWHWTATCLNQHPHTHSSTKQITRRGIRLSIPSRTSRRSLSQSPPPPPPPPLLYIHTVHTTRSLARPDHSRPCGRPGLRFRPRSADRRCLPLM